MARYPAAIWRPVARFNPGGTKAVKRKKGRGVCNHVAASEAASLFNYFNTPGSPCSHFYVRKSGVVEQYVDTNYVAPANLEGNSTLLSIETQGGVNNVESEPWTDDQIDALVELHAWLQADDGFPVRIMENSLSSTKGIGWHELGVDPVRVSGGEKWSEAYGKVCPGNEKIRQIKTVIYPRLTHSGDDGTMSWTDTQIEEAVSAMKTCASEMLETTQILRTEAVRSDNLVNKQLPDLRSDTEALKTTVAKLETSVQAMSTILQDIKANTEPATA